MKHRGTLVALIVSILTSIVMIHAGARLPPASQGTPATGGGTPQPGAPAPAPGAPAVSGSRIQFVIGDANVVRVPAETTTVTVTNVPGLEKLPAGDVAKLADTLAITDLGLARGLAVPGKVELLKPDFVGRVGANGLTWRVPLKADVPLGTSHPRVARAIFGVEPDVQTYALEYTVSTKPSASAQWTPRGATDIWTVSWSDVPKDRMYGVTIENQDEPLSNLRIAQSTLKDASGHTIGVDRFRLIESLDAQTRSGIEVSPNSTKTVFLRLEPGESSGPFGTFDGVVRFAADGSPTMKDVALKLQASSTRRKVIGVVLTLAGLLLSVFVSALARPQLARLEARRAAAAVREAISQFEAELSLVVPADVPTPTTTQVAARLARSISDEELDQNGLLPKGFTVMPGAEAPADRAAALKTRLDEVSKVVEGLLVLLRSGITRILPHVKTPNPATALSLIKELDDFAGRVTGPQDARTKVDDVVSRIPTTKESASDTPAREVSVQEIDFRIQTLSAAAWSIWALIALAIGAAWVVSDVDYGTPIDLVSSFLWGFGMTTFGAGIQNLTPASVSTQMNVKVPR